MKTFHKILIANRGEIAVRVIRAARKAGILTVAIYASDDVHSLHVTLADEAFELKGLSLNDTYLHQQQIIRIALESEVQAIHPGYGFLAENAGFAQEVCEAGLIFIGPTAENIWLMGEKIQAITYVESLGIPVLPTFHGTIDELILRSPEMEFPVMVKASGGGGGKGMIICNSEDELLTDLKMAERQALNYFSNGDLFVEKYLPIARHIEVQLLADHHGNILHFQERECSIQRRFQKIIEEAPSPSINHDLREKLTSASIKIARSINYRNAGTIEFLVDEKDRFYFLEMNTRIQVEHPVTEMITNTDLISLQLHVAAGNPLNIQQDDIQAEGHSIEVRLCAEDVLRNFLPSAGKLVLWDLPAMPNVRIETFASQGTSISSAYDSLLAKIVVWAETRSQAIDLMQKVLSDSYISGIHTNVLLLSKLIGSKDFKDNKVYTQYVDQHLESINAQIQEREVSFDKHLLVIAWFIFHFQQNQPTANTIWKQIGFWRMYPQVNVSILGTRYNCQTIPSGKDQIFTINDTQYMVSAFQFKNKNLDIQINHQNESFYCMEENQLSLIGHHGFVFELQSNSLLFQAKVERPHEKVNKIFQNLICAELFGKVLTVNISENEQVEAGQNLLTLESMKTEIHVLSPVDGRVKKIYVSNGNNVLEKQLLLELEPVFIQDLSYLEKGSGW